MKKYQFNPARPDGWPASVYLRMKGISDWIVDHFDHFETNREMADFLNVGLVSLRTRVIELGLKRMELEYWTPEQVQHLLDLYQTKGDTEIAEIFAQTYPKQKGWTNKHIEKKRLYLKLNRTEAQLLVIEAVQHRADPAEYAALRTGYRVKGEVGEVRIFRKKTGKPYAAVKCEDGAWRPYGPILWEKHHGPVPPDHFIMYRNGDLADCRIENLVCVHRSEWPQHTENVPSRTLPDSYVASLIVYRAPKELKKLFLDHPELIALKRQQLLLRRTLLNTVQK